MGSDALSLGCDDGSWAVGYAQLRREVSADISECSTRLSSTMSLEDGLGKATDVDPRLQQFGRQHARAIAERGFRVGHTLFHHVWEVVSPPRDSFQAAVFSLSSSAMGVGCLSLPFMFENAGILTGLAMLIAGAVLAHLSIVVLMLSARRTNATNLAALISPCRKSGVGVTVTLVVAIYGIAAVMCCLIFAGDFVSSILRSPFLGFDVARETVICALATLVILPLSLLRSLTALRHVSTFNVLAIFITAVVVMSKMPAHARSHGDDATQALRWWTSEPYSLLRSFSIALLAFAAHTNAVPVASTLRQADRMSICRVSLCSVCIELIVYCLMGLGGYLSFRGGTKQNFILNYRDDDLSIFLVRCICGAVVCLGAPINLSPAVSSILSILGLVSGHQHEGCRLSRCAVVLPIIAGCTCVAAWNEDVADILGLLGASFGSLLVLGWPALICRKVLLRSEPPHLFRLVFISLAGSYVIGCVAFAMQVRGFCASA